MKFFTALQLLLLSSVFLLAQNKEAVSTAEKDDFKNPTANQRLVNAYEKDPAAWPDHSLLPVAICYALSGNFPLAESLYVKFLAQQPDSTRGLRGLGNCLVLQKKYAEGMEQFRKAWALQDVQSLAQLTFVCIMTKNWEELDKLVPDLVANRQKDIGIVNCLIALSMVREPRNKALFYQAIEGIPDDVLMKRPDTRDAVLKALALFGDEKRIKELQAKIPPELPK